MEGGFKARDIGEFGLIRAIAGLSGAHGEGVLVGIGDDAAVLQPAEGMVLVATCDSQVEGVHFSLDNISAGQLGSRLAQINLSDLAAMGARPRWALVSIHIPPDTGVSFIEDLYAGLIGDLEATGAVVVGGNTSRSPRGLCLDVTLLGDARRESVLTRDSAMPGNIFCVTGDLGASAAGLAALKAGEISSSDQGSIRAVVKRHLEPRARLAAGHHLSRDRRATSCIDLSDGLLGDAAHICNRSGVSIEIDAALLPIDDSARSVSRALGIDPLRMALCGGEDYELAFTVPALSAEEVLSSLTAATGLRATAVGRVLEGAGGVVVVDGDGEPMNFEGAFTHFEGDG